MTKYGGAQTQSQRQGAGGEGGGQGRGKKRKRHSKYLQHSGKKSTIAAGLEGFLITCVGGKERQSIREAINLLDQFLESPETEARGATGDEQATTSSSDPSAAGAKSQPEQQEQQPSSNSSEIDAGAALPADVTEVRGPANENDNGNDDDDSSETSAGELDGEDFGWIKCRRLDKSSCAERSCGGGAEYGGDELATPVKDEQQSSTEPKVGGGVGSGEASSKSFDELLAAELEELRNPKKIRFVGYETGCNGVIFVRMNSEKGSVHKGPKELAEAIVRDAATSKKSRSRFCMRLLPVELTCYASAAELQKVAEPLIARHFPKDPKQPSYKFAVICETRANTNLNKMEFIHAVAKMVPEPHSVDLKNPDKTILIQVVKTACAVGVVQDFKELAKYNLRQLTSQTPAPESKSS